MGHKLIAQSAIIGSHEARYTEPQPREAWLVISLKEKKEGLAVASTARDDPFPLPGMLREHNALPSQTDRRSLTS